ncbi:MAG: efflux RND transporter periplasmic adaptor subunit [Verrucomicrobiales bacterium]|nr:efflux RND transporter periplasmic adaptor subunit [Verrucomicrobiales bacterium]
MTAIRPIYYSLFAVILILVSPLRVHANPPVIGVTEPVEEIDLAFPEVGVIASILVEEGQTVKKGDLLARLDARSHEARQKIAAMKAESTSAIRSAEAEMGLREERLEKLKGLGSGNTNPDELARASVDYETSLSRYELAVEESAQAKIELEQVTIEIERRTLRSPIDGVVTRILRDEAESVGGGETLVMSVVNLEQLDLIVHIETGIAEQMAKMGTVMVDRVGEEGGRFLAKASVMFVSPVVDASSGTRRVRLRLDNADGVHVSGVKYQVQLSAPPGLSMRGE